MAGPRTAGRAPPRRRSAARPPAVLGRPQVLPARLADAVLAERADQHPQLQGQALHQPAARCPGPRPPRAAPPGPGRPRGRPAPGPCTRAALPHPARTPAGSPRAGRSGAGTRPAAGPTWSRNAVGAQPVPPSAPSTVTASAPACQATARPRPRRGRRQLHPAPGPREVVAHQPDLLAQDLRGERARAAAAQHRSPSGAEARLHGVLVGQPARRGSSSTIVIPPRPGLAPWPDLQLEGQPARVSSG